MDLKNIRLIDLQTSHMKRDPTTRALCEALNPQFKRLAEETKICLIYSRVDELDHEALDELAWQIHVDYYDPTFSLETKIKIVKLSLKWHRKKGTPTAVEEAIATIFGRSWIDEWFEYGGDPYYFRVNIEASERGAAEKDLNMAEQLVKEYKNTRSWLEKINIFLTTYGKIYYGCAALCGEQVTVYPWTTTEISASGRIFYALGNQAIEKVTVYPKEVE